MQFSLLAHLKLSFWSIYGRFVWDQQLTPPPHVQHVLALLAAQPSDDTISILDLGCGTGIYALPLAQAGFHVTGIDAAPGMLARAYPKVSPQEILLWLLSRVGGSVSVELGIGRVHNYKVCLKNSTTKYNRLMRGHR
jgi:SAM-dependent methyltransferase